MAKANLTLSRRMFMWGATATAPAIALRTVAAATPAAAAPNESEGRFKCPADYLAALQAIGWRPVAMYQRLEDGGVQCMGVGECGQSEQHMLDTWRKYHAISLRTPTQLPFDVHPKQDWWEQVWHYLYDRGLREDVTPPKLAARLDRLSEVQS